MWPHMSKKIISLLFLLIVLVTVTIGYAYFTQPATQSQNQGTTGETVDENTLANEMNSTLVDENQGVEIGDII
jgi:CHASE3 domain sensor protein